MGMVSVAFDVERLREVCERYGVVRLEVFGSVARGVTHLESDIDLLYTLGPGVRLGWAIEDLAEELSVVLGRPVDLVSRRALNARLRDQVLQEAQPFYAAA
ncbi:MAG: nucleotidyltransferase domain-containing protein [Propionibacteriaceae bacterium]|nr:nucleotidyltransferase domain-containing protein [Propionibacteriaceae bacterium]